jgi:hypothetical protein
MTQTSPAVHLVQLRETVARLVARLEAQARDLNTFTGSDASLDLGRALLRQVALVEAALAADRANADAPRPLDVRSSRSVERTPAQSDATSFLYLG